MPSKGQHNPLSFRAQVLDWLDHHPGLHTCSEIAAGMGIAAQPGAVHRVAVAARGLWSTGRAVRGDRKYGRRVSGLADTLNK